MKLIAMSLIMTAFYLLMAFETNMVAGKHHDDIYQAITESKYPCDAIKIAVVDGYDRVKVKCENGNKFNVYGRGSETVTVLPAEDSMIMIPGPLF